MKKGDFIVILAVILLAVSFIFIRPRYSGKKVVIKQNNQILYTENLSENKKLKLDGNTVVIENGFVYVSEASCKNQVCVHHKKISKKGEVIACLPHKLSVEVEG